MKSANRSQNTWGLIGAIRWLQAFRGKRRELCSQIAWEARASRERAAVPVRRGEAKGGNSEHLGKIGLIFRRDQIRASWDWDVWSVTTGKNRLVPTHRPIGGCFHGEAFLRKNASPIAVFVIGDTEADLSVFNVPVFHLKDYWDVYPLMVKLLGKRKRRK